MDESEVAGLIIDMHVSPAFIDELHQSETQLQTCRRLTGLYETDTQPVSFMKTMCKVPSIQQQHIMLIWAPMNRLLNWYKKILIYLSALPV